MHYTKNGVYHPSACDTRRILLYGIMLSRASFALNILRTREGPEQVMYVFSAVKRPSTPSPMHWPYGYIQQRRYLQTTFCSMRKCHSQRWVSRPSKVASATTP